MTNLADSLLIERSLPVLEITIGLLRKDIQRHRPSHPLRSDSLNNFAKALLARFSSSSHSDLSEAGRSLLRPKILSTCYEHRSSSDLFRLVVDFFLGFLHLRTRAGSLLVNVDESRQDANSVLSILIRFNESVDVNGLDKSIDLYHEVLLWP